jgi:iron complex transport system substrate-binding protein
MGSYTKKKSALLRGAFAAFCCLLCLGACSKAKGTAPAGPSEGEGTREGPVSAETSRAGTVYPLSLENVDASGRPYTQVFTKAPERVVATTQGNIEALLKLGLGSRIAGAANIISDFPEDIRAEGEALPLISNQGPPMELVLGASPDIVMGRAMDFNDGEYGLGTVEAYTAMGINSYIWASSSLTGDPKLEDIIGDIRNIGLIFDIQPAANALADELQEKLDKLKAVLADRPGGKKALMISDFDGSTYGQYGAKAKLQNDFLAKLGFVNATEQAGTSLGLETMIALNPDMIIYIDYADSPLNAQAAVADLLAQESLQNVPAIANRQVFLVPFNDIMGHGYCTIEGLANLAEQLYPGLM